MSDLVQNIVSVLKPANVQGVAHDVSKQRRRSRDNPHFAKNHEHDCVEHENEGAVLSVKALILFLEDFIETRLDSTQLKSNNDTVDDLVFAPWMRHKPINSNSQRDVRPDAAAKAYTRVAYGASYQPKTVEVPHKESLRVVYGLIQDLRTLKARGVTHLSISSDRNFLAGIRFSVEQKLSE